MLPSSPSKARLPPCIYVACPHPNRLQPIKRGGGGESFDDVRLGRHAAAQRANNRMVVGKAAQPFWGRRLAQFFSKNFCVLPRSESDEGRRCAENRINEILRCLLEVLVAEYQSKPELASL